MPLLADSWGTTKCFTESTLRKMYKIDFSKLCNHDAQYTQRTSTSLGFARHFIACGNQPPAGCPSLWAVRSARWPLQTLLAASANKTIPLTGKHETPKKKKLIDGPTFSQNMAARKEFHHGKPHSLKQTKKKLFHNVIKLTCKLHVCWIFTGWILDFQSEQIEILVSFCGALRFPA